MPQRRKRRQKLPVPWYPQLTESWCVPASLQSLLEYWEIKVTQEHLAHMLKTTKEGTDTKEIKNVLRLYGLVYRSQVGGTYRMIDHALDQLKPAFIEYKDPDPDSEERHVAVVTKLTSHTILMQDPWMGEDWRMKRSEFSPRWRNQHYWMLVVHGQRKPKGRRK